MGRLDRDEIIEALKENRDSLDRFDVERIGLFGSYIRGEQDESSDIDFIVEFEENSFDNYMGLKLFLEDLFDRSVDLAIESDIRSELSHVKEEAEYVPAA